MARAFHQDTGRKATVVSIVATREIRGSKILEMVVDPHVEEPAGMAGAIRAVAHRHDEPVLVVSCMDPYVLTLVGIREGLPGNVVVPYAPTEKIHETNDKVFFAGLCAREGVPHPRTWVVDRDQADAPEGIPDVGFLKPVDYGEWMHLRWSGRKKVYRYSGVDELRSILSGSRENGYTGRFVLQEEVPGTDSQMEIMTLYRDHDGVVTVAHGGHVGLEEHTPGTLGNPAAIFTGPLPTVASNAEKLLEALDWVGFANFDIKVHPETGVGYFFELNPRTGRSNYYLTACGINPWVVWRNDWVSPRRGTVQRSRREVLYRTVPIPLMWRYLSPQQRRMVRGRRTVNPVFYWRDWSLRRNYWVLGVFIKQFWRFHKFYPLSASRRLS